MALVLSRKEGEEIVIGEDIKIAITKIKGNRVAFAITAPRDLKVMRTELVPNATKRREDKPT